VETTTSPLLEVEYFVLHATSMPIDTKIVTPKIQENLVRILRFISCKQTTGRTHALPSSPKPD
jgi:hypothetical protein